MSPLMLEEGVIDSCLAQHIAEELQIGLRSCRSSGKRHYNGARFSHACRGYSKRQSITKRERDAIEVYKGHKEAQHSLARHSAAYAHYWTSISGRLDADENRMRVMQNVR